MESDLIPQQARLHIPARAVLVLAPHADDEVFGCGGAIVAHVRAGVSVKVIILTDGAVGGDAATRRDEALAAASILGYGNPAFWGLPDRGLHCTQALIERVANAVRDAGADLLYAPSHWEVHPDHRQAAQLASEAALRTGCRVAFYEVGAPLRPNLLIDISESVEVKRRAMELFASQNAVQDYPRQIAALNQYRSYTLPRPAVAAEAFLVLTAAELLAQFRATGAHGVSLGSSPSEAALDPAPPLVSILIRSVDRDHLQEALDSISLQTYPNIEVVVIAAKPGHRLLPQRCGPHPIRLIPTDLNLPRSLAANRALEEAGGEWLMFLDDDDWLTPGHVARLAAVVQRQPKVRAAYAGIALVDTHGRPVDQTLDLPFDGVRQLAGNTMPIHAVLFSRSLLADGLRFDEYLERYEDWDFWLQLAKLTVPVHLPGISALYRVHESSGVHDDAGPAGAATQAIYRKWQASWSESQLKGIMERVWVACDLQPQVTQLRQDLRASHALVTQQAGAAAEHSVTLAQQSAALAQQSGALAQQSAALAQQSAALAQQNTVLAQQSALITEQRATIAGQEEAITLLRHEVLQRSALVDVREREIGGLMNSSSWKITKPLRWLSGKLKGN